jgi:hypothetical protein
MKRCSGTDETETAELVRVVSGTVFAEASAGTERAPIPIEPRLRAEDFCRKPVPQCHVS